MNRANSQGDNWLIVKFIHHPNAANLLMVLLILFGVFSLSRINAQFFPTIENPTVTVSFVWSGASAQDVEGNILAIAEPDLRYVEGVDHMFSTASEGGGNIVLVFDEGVDMDEALATVETVVKRISNLPQDAETPSVSRKTFFDNVAKLAVTGDVSEGALRVWAKRIRDDLVARGIDKIEFTGLRDREIQVNVPENQLRRLQMSVDDVSNAIRKDSRDLPSGNIKGQSTRQVRALADVSSVRDVGEIALKSLPTGEKVLLGDIAQLKEGYDDDQIVGFSKGNRAIELSILRAPSADTLKTAQILDDYLTQIRPNLPGNIKLETYEVAADLLSDRIWLLVKNGIGGLAIVLAALFLFLNFRVAFWVAAGIPVAMLATIGFMYVSGQTINMISLFALIMMLGVIVDDAIVVGEHTDTCMANGDAPFVAAQNGVGRMMVPVMAALTTTLASFSPILLISGQAGQIIGVLPLVVIAVILASVLECFFILPGHLAHSLEKATNAPRWSFIRQLSFAIIVACGLTYLQWPIEFASLSDAFGALSASNEDGSRIQPLFMLIGLIVCSLGMATLLEAVVWYFSKPSNQASSMKPTGFRAVFDRGFNAFRDYPFNSILGLSFRWRYVTLSIAAAMVIIVVGGLLMSKRVGFVFFPTPEAENINGFLTMHPDTPKEQTIAAIREIEEALEGVEKRLGGDEKIIRFIYAKQGSGGANRAQLNVQLTNGEMRSVRTADIVRAWQESIPQLPGMERFAVVERRGGPGGRDIDIRLFGPSAEILKTAAGDLVDVLSGISGVSGVQDDLKYGKPELIMELTPRGSALGFSIEDVGKQVRNAFEGAIPLRFVEDSDEVTVRVNETLRQRGIAGLYGLELRNKTGQFVPLSEVVTLKENQGFASIWRYNGKSAISITGDIDYNITTLDKVMTQLENTKIIDQIIARYGVEREFGGSAEEQKEALFDLQVGTASALACIYIILAWVFGSYWRPFAVMLIIPFGLVGSVFGHWVMGYQMTILSLIGLLGLAGILVNDSIILVARLDERLAQGDNIEAAAVGASRDRLRAVLLTSLTTIGGLFPLMYEKSLQAQFLLPMAITIVFGLALATLLVLFLVPTLIGIGFDIGGIFSSLFGKGNQNNKPKKPWSVQLTD